MFADAELAWPPASGRGSRPATGSRLGEWFEWTNGRTKMKNTHQGALLSKKLVVLVLYKAHYKHLSWL